MLRSFLILFFCLSSGSVLLAQKKSSDDGIRNNNAPELYLHVNDTTARNIITCGKTPFIKTTNGGRFISARVTFTGTGFENMPTGKLTSTSLAPLKIFLTQCSNGSSVVFEEIKIKGSSGKERVLEPVIYELKNDSVYRTVKPKIRS